MRLSSNRLSAITGFTLTTFCPLALCIISRQQAIKQYILVLKGSNTGFLKYQGIVTMLYRSNPTKKSTYYFESAFS
jgi:hypothetical protein